MDSHSVSSHGSYAINNKENYLQQSDFHSIDASRIEGLKNTSLSVLNSKKTHKTQTQKQFQQYHQQQLNQQQLNQQQRQSHFRPLQQNPYHQGSQQPQHAGHPQYAQPQYYNTMAPPPSLRPPGSMSRQSFNSMTSSNYSQSHVPSMLPQGEWSGNLSPTKSPSLRMGSFTSNTQFAPPQQEYKAVSPVLSTSEWDRPFQEERIKELEQENEKLIEENEELHRNTEVQSKAICEENGQLQTQLDSVKMELNKLKLEHNSMKKSHESEFKKLKDKNNELQVELENASEMNSRSTETTPNGSPRTVSGNSESTSQPFPESSKILQQAQSNIENNDLIQDLLETIKYLKAGNNVLQKQNDDLIVKLNKDKKMLKKLVNSTRHQAKIRKGFNVLESVDTFI